MLTTPPLDPARRRDAALETTVTRTGGTHIPAVVRKRHGIQAGDRLAWLDDGQSIRIIPIPEDPLEALNGAGRGEELLSRLIQSRREDRER